jgi:hypothetical protein
MTGLAPGLLPRPESLIMWNGTVRALPFVEQVAAMRPGGAGRTAV